MQEYLSLLYDMFYAAPEVWYAAATVMGLMFAVIIWQLFQILRLKQKVYFVNRDRERYAETLYASRDGYFAFIYPDQKINDPRRNIVERCSRRLAVIMNLPAGVKSSFDDILHNFYKDDVKKIQKYVALLRDEGVSFDDEFMLKSAPKYLRLVGVRINGADGNIYCDMIWFRDVSFEADRINSLEQAKNNYSAAAQQLQEMIDHLPFPVWLRNDKLEIINCNKKYADLCGAPREQTTREHLEIAGNANTRELARGAHAANRPRQTAVNVVKDGERLVMRAYEAPFHAGESLELIYTVGAMTDMSELDEIKQNLKNHQNAQLEILGTLGTAFAVFDQHLKLAFHNRAFADLWQLEDGWFEEEPSYGHFLDTIREKRLLPEVPDYVMFKNEELKKFGKLVESQKDMLHLPNGKTLYRLRAPYPAGGLIFAYEDITDRLAATSAYNMLISVQLDILQNLFEAVLVFGTNGRLNFYNQSYVDLWKADKTFLDGEPTLEEVLETQRVFFGRRGKWTEIKQEIASHLLSMTTKSFTLSRNGKDAVEVLSKNLPDGSMMITYKPAASD